MSKLTIISDRVEKYVLHVLHNSSLQPVMTFWLASCIAIPLMFAGWINQWTGIVSLGFVAIIMVALADRRDSRRESIVLVEKVDVIHDLVDGGINDAKEKRILQLITVLKCHGIRVPPKEF